MIPSVFAYSGTNAVSVLLIYSIRYHGNSTIIQQFYDV